MTSTGIETQGIPQMVTLFNPYVASILLLLALFIGKILFNFADAVTDWILKKNRNDIITKELSFMKEEQMILRRTLPIDYVRSIPYERDIAEVKTLIKSSGQETKEFIRTLISGVEKRIDDSVRKSA